MCGGRVTRPGDRAVPKKRSGLTPSIPGIRERPTERVRGGRTGAGIGI